MICVKIINKSDLPLPEYKSTGASGMDLMSNVNDSIILKPFDRALIPTGLFIELPEGFEAQVRARSGLSIKHGITIVNGIGTIDSDYRGEIKIPLINLSQESFTIKKGDRIAQMVVMNYIKVQLEISNDLSRSNRDINGFGSTGI